MDEGSDEITQNKKQTLKVEISPAKASLSQKNFWTFLRGETVNEWVEAETVKK